MAHLSLHRDTLIGILRAIYSDTLLRSVLGFKGGTAAMLFYGLPRFSVDLDFDLLEPGKKEEVFQRLTEILPQFGSLTQAQDKQYTLFFLINYQKGERNLKIDISKRPLRHEYAPKNYLGIPMTVMKEEDMAASKLSALLTRRKFATRDMFDLWFFLKENWQIDERVVRENTTMSLAAALEKAQTRVQAVKKTEILAGLGELLLDEKQKVYVREKLQDDLVFYLRLYQDTHNRAAKSAVRLKEELPDDIPVLDIEPNLGGRGGTAGHFVHFAAINTGEKVAIDCRWGIRGFGYEWRSHETFVLRPQDKKKLEYKVSSEKPFKEFVPELNIFFEYKTNKGLELFTRRELVLEKVPSDLFYNITKVGTFHPAVALKDSKIRKISEPYVPQGNFTTEVVVDVEIDGEIRQVKIGLAPGLTNIFGFSRDELKTVFSELVQRKVRNMLREGKLHDHIFSSEEMPKKLLSGFEAYKALRDSLD